MMQVLPSTSTKHISLKMSSSFSANLKFQINKNGSEFLNDLNFIKGLFLQLLHHKIMLGNSKRNLKIEMSLLQKL